VNGPVVWNFDAPSARPTLAPTYATAEPSVAEQDVSDAPSPQSSKRWKWRAIPYLFGANLEGDLKVGSTTVSTDVSFSDLLEDLDFGGFFMFEGHGERWGFMTDTAFIDLGEEGEGPNGVTRRQTSS
jgi:hypothetical protein